MYTVPHSPESSPVMAGHATPPPTTSPRRRRSLASAGLGCSAVATLMLGLGLLLLFASGIAMRSLSFRPPPQLDVEVRCEPDTPPVPTGRKLRVLVWNIQFSAGRDHHFFYDGGNTVSVDRPTVERTLKGIAEVIREVDADLVLLQEVDRGSRRTVFVDQHEALRAAVPYPCDLSTPYFRSRYIPYPPHEHLGKMDMHLSVFSRYAIDQATRHALALLDEPWIRQQFNLKRALLQMRLPRQDGGSLHLFNTHLSAFSHGDGTLPRQVAQLETRLSEVEAAGGHWILGGDLNSLPPGDDPDRLGADGTLYSKESPIAPLIERYEWPVPIEEYRRDPSPWRTYLPFGSAHADRMIDYVLHGRGIRPHGYSVRAQDAAHSDHLPLVFDFEVR